MDFDLIIKGGTVVTADAGTVQDIGIANGKIVAVEADCGTQAKQFYDATGKTILPGIIDPHVHFNEPGRGHWEGFLTGSQAAVAGGITAYFEMPLNASPPTTTLEAFNTKKAIAEEKSFCDFALWGGLVPENLDQLQLLYEAGVIGFKAFMSNSGMDDFQHIDVGSLKQGMEIIAQLPGMRLALHAEDDQLTYQLAQEKIAQGKLSAYDYEASRPIESECNAIQQAIDLAGETRCPIHIVHVSCSEGIALIQQAKKDGVDITCETCPHYLCLSIHAVDALGALAKCAPPLRYPETVDALWKDVTQGAIDVIGTDHSPCPSEMKNGTSIFDTWGGISGIQHGYPLFLGQACKREIALNTLSPLLQQNTAAIFNLSERKGSLAIGKDADCCVLSFDAGKAIETSDLFYKNKHSPYVGQTPGCTVEATFVRGEKVFCEGQFVSKSSGQCIMPSRPN